jgi:hypothetical protein
MGTNGTYLSERPLCIAYRPARLIIAFSSLQVTFRGALTISAIAGMQSNEPSFHRQL